MRNAAGEIRRATKRAEAAALNRWRATNASSANLNRGTSKATTPAGWISAKLKRVRDNQRNGRHVFLVRVFTRCERKHDRAITVPNADRSL